MVYNSLDRFAFIVTYILTDENTMCSTSYAMSNEAISSSNNRYKKQTNKQTNNLFESLTIGQMKFGSYSFSSFDLEFYRTVDYFDISTLKTISLDYSRIGPCAMNDDLPEVSTHSATVSEIILH